MLKGSIENDPSHLIPQGTLRRALVRKRNRRGNTEHFGREGTAKGRGVGSRGVNLSVGVLRQTKEGGRQGPSATRPGKL